MISLAAITRRWTRPTLPQILARSPHIGQRRYLGKQGVNRIIECGLRGPLTLGAAASRIRVKITPQNLARSARTSANPKRVPQLK